MTDSQGSGPAQTAPSQPLQPVDLPKRKPVPTNNGPVAEPVPVAVADDHGHEQPQNIASDPEKDVANGTWVSRPVNKGNLRRFALPVLSLAVFDKVRLGPLDKYLPYEQRKRRYTISGIFAGLIIAFLALIIGLAVGLTVGKNK